jgi:hypothetical protein
LTRTLRSVRHDDETNEWVFDFGEGYVLQAAAPWRLVRNGSVAAAGGDHGQQFGLAAPIDVTVAIRELVGNHIVEEAVAANGPADLTIDFGEGMRLEVFGDSSAFESWVLNGPGGRAFVAQGGGGLVEWDADAPNSSNHTDWRLQSQEKYLQGATLIRREYRRYARNTKWDHDHCEFCAAKFSVESLPDTLQEGYATRDGYRWVCSTCFEDFKEMFSWTLGGDDA